MSYPLFHIPIFVARPAVTAQVRSPAPSVRAGRAFAARFKRVPHRITAAVKIFGRVRIGAAPLVGNLRRPIAQRTANPLEIGFFFFLQRFEDFFNLGRFLVKHKIFLKITVQKLSIK